MNTQQLQQHLASSLNGLANACENNQKTEKTDRLVLQILSDDRMDGEVLLQYISDIRKETEEICPQDMFETGVNLNELYNILEPEFVTQKKVLKELQAIACQVDVSEDVSSRKHSGIISFIYKTLRSLNNTRECKKVLSEIGIVESIYNS